MHQDQDQSETLFSDFLNVTPQLAAKWLDEQVNKENRYLSEKRIQYHEGIYKRGEHNPDVLPGITLKGTSANSWKDPDELLNGQHRLTAQVRLKLTLRRHVQVVPNRNVMGGLDTGSSRTTGDFLTFLGKPNANNMGAALRVIHQYDSRQMHMTGIDKLTNDQVKTLLKRYPGLDRWPSLTAGSPARHGLLTAFAYLFSQVDERKAMAYVDGVKDGLPGTAVGQLHSQLIKVKAKKHHEMQPQMLAGRMIKAWNYFIDDRNPKMLKFDSTLEEFPEISGRPPRCKLPTRDV